MTARTEPPSELDRLDPAPPRPPRPPRAPRRRKGKVEAAVDGYVRTLPDKLRKDPVAAASLLLAAQLDGGLLPEDATHALLDMAVQLDEGGLEPEDAADRLRALARRLAGSMSARDSAGHAREMRMCLAQLREWNPGGETGDATDEARAQVEAVGGLYAVPDS
jgi:hypothetical protein